MTGKGVAYDWRALLDIEVQTEEVRIDFLGSGSEKMTDAEIVDEIERIRFRGPGCRDEKAWADSFFDVVMLLNRRKRK